MCVVCSIHFSPRSTAIFYYVTPKAIDSYCWILGSGTDLFAELCSMVSSSSPSCWKLSTKAIFAESTTGIESAGEKIPMLVNTLFVMDSAIVAIPAAESEAVLIAGPKLIPPPLTSEISGVAINGGIEEKLDKWKSFLASSAAEWGVVVKLATFSGVWTGVLWPPEGVLSPFASIKSMAILSLVVPTIERTK